MNKLNFDDYNFEVINVETTGNYLLTLNKNSITFDKSVAEALGYSSHIRPLLDRENKIFAIQACKANSLKSIPFSKSESQQKGSIKMQYGALRNILRSLMKDKWKEEMRYQLEGELIPDKKAMIFELEKFNELPLKSRKGN
ncbi:hypothetical protein ACQZP6_001428 [Enterococcus hirae]|uniref:hypothetical protein n=1 Tax=Enterococcus faecium TaxID=1352 RepID=UPI000A346F9B|nr:hypothetical protein [Enterococcus faecium]EMF0171273.1 hypothetical protein [Enterococcus hirae]EMF0491634.1 hypothetical protein [Enterococcus faecium]EMF0537751.1 hypothetical protein [Enterococcus hirae]MCU1961780.1 hypothetical protein [Enterococcus faecium]MDQ8561849.1 hypothetical protein [Enterococcus faecium]